MSSSNTLLYQGFKHLQKHIKWLIELSPLYFHFWLIFIFNPEIFNVKVTSTIFAGSLSWIGCLDDAIFSFLPTFYNLSNKYCVAAFVLALVQVLACLVLLSPIFSSLSRHASFHTVWVVSIVYVYRLVMVGHCLFFTMVALLKFTGISNLGLTFWYRIAWFLCTDYKSVCLLIMIPVNFSLVTGIRNGACSLVGMYLWCFIRYKFHFGRANL